jgi:hypothetical protein
MTVVHGKYGWSVAMSRSVNGTLRATTSVASSREDVDDFYKPSGRPKKYPPRALR